MGGSIIKSGAIIDYIIRHHGGGRLQPDPATPAYDDYVQWLHFAEGSAMLPMLLKLYVSLLGDAAAPLVARIESEIANHLGYINAALTGRDYLLGDDLTGADIQMSFVGEIAGRTRPTAPPIRTSRRGCGASRRVQPTRLRSPRVARTAYAA